MRRPARILGIVAVTMAVLATGQPPTPAVSGRPNILIILTDDQRPETLSVMPQTRQWFEAGGTSFPNAFATTPLCCPSRSTIYTGRYAHNHQVRTNKDADLLKAKTTVQRHLHQRGYRTAITGKFLNSWRIRNDPPWFDRWALTRGGYRDFKTNVDGALGTSGVYHTRWVGRQAVRFLRSFENKDADPWLLYVNTLAPHGPFLPEKKYENASVPSWVPRPGVIEVDRTDKPPWVRARNASMRGASTLRTKQLRTLMSVDDLVGRLREELARLSEGRRTLAIFLSDNGYFWAEHGLVDKRLPYTEAVHIPFLMRWPGRVSPRAVDRRFVATVDMVPTIMDAAGIGDRSPRRGLDGRSLLRSPTRERMLFEYWLDRTGAAYPDWGSIRAADMQYVEYYGRRGSVIFREYYDLRTDPWQLQNLLGDGIGLNDPPDAELAVLSSDLAALRRCRGTAGSAGCP